MYPEEMKTYIEQRNFNLDKGEILYVTDISLHSQLTHITYNPWDNSYDMWDRYGNYFHFSVKE